MVSSAKIEITARIFMAKRLDSDCGQKRLRLVRFRDDPGKHHGPPGHLSKSTKRRPDQPRLDGLFARENALNAAASRRYMCRKEPANIGQHRMISGFGRRRGCST